MPSRQRPRRIQLARDPGLLRARLPARHDRHALARREPRHLPLFRQPDLHYSLKQGIDDGFLAPYRVHRIVTQWDAAGWRPSKDDLDRYGREIPDEVYTTADFERRVALRARTQAVARHLTDFLKKTDRFAKTIVFCVDQEHAAEMRTALNNLNADLVLRYPDYVCRVTADEGDIGRGHMQRFQDVETRTPVILTTSQLLTTGLDAPTCRNIVLVRLVNSMVEFKQIIGRGTRVRDDYGKLWFNILDYTGTATRNFADPAFDGDPAFATQEEIDEHGQTKRSRVETPEEPETKSATARWRRRPLRHRTEEKAGVRNRKYYFDGGQVEIVAELVHETRRRRQATPRRQAHRLHRRESALPLCPARRTCAPAGPMPASAPTSSINSPNVALISSRSPPRQASRTPTRSISSATSPSRPLPRRPREAGPHPPPARRPRRRSSRPRCSIT